jgi:hypothetical protein
VAQRNPHLSQSPREKSLGCQLLCLSTNAMFERSLTSDVYTRSKQIFAIMGHWNVSLWLTIGAEYLKYSRFSAITQTRVQTIPALFEQLSEISNMLSNNTTLSSKNDQSGRKQKFSGYSVLKLQLQYCCLVTYDSAHFQSVSQATHPPLPPPPPAQWLQRMYDRYDVMGTKAKVLTWRKRQYGGICYWHPASYFCHLHVQNRVINMATGTFMSCSSTVAISRILTEHLIEDNKFRGNLQQQFAST